MKSWISRASSWNVVEARDHARQLVSRAKSALAHFADKAAILAAAADYVVKRAR